MKNALLLIYIIVIALPLQAAHSQSSGVAQREVHFYSEGVLCYGKLFLPIGYSDSSKVAAVILAADAPQTSAALDSYAAAIAARGVLAMTFDYRGFGKSGGFLYFGEPVRFDDRDWRIEALGSVRPARWRSSAPAARVGTREALEADSDLDRGPPGDSRSR